MRMNLMDHRRYIENLDILRNDLLGSLQATKSQPPYSSRSKIVYHHGKLNVIDSIFIPPDKYSLSLLHASTSLVLQPAPRYHN